MRLAAFTIDVVLPGNENLGLPEDSFESEVSIDLDSVVAFYKTKRENGDFGTGISMSSGDYFFVKEDYIEVKKLFKFKFDLAGSRGACVCNDKEPQECQRKSKISE